MALNTIESTSLTSILAIASFHFGKLSTLSFMSALAGAGLVLETLREYPYSNGCRTNKRLVMDDARRWHWPPGFARLPLMFGLSARKP